MTSGSDLTLPGDIPGLLRRGSPFRRKSVAGTVVEIEDGSVLIVAWVARDGEGRTDVLDPEDLLLDLADATGRAHATWWLASAVMPQAAAPIAWLWCMGDGRWSLRSGGDWVTFRAPGSPEPSERRPEVPALASLDPNDRHRLSDGSWRVNAEALRLVCLHVAGRAP